MSQDNQKVIDGKGVWSPYLLAAVAVLLSILPALVLFAINYGRYGFPKKRFQWFCIIVLIAPIIIALDYISPEWTIVRMFALNVAGIWLMYSQQIGLYQDWKLQKRPQGSGWQASFIVLATLILFFCIYLIPIPQQDYLAYDLLESGRYEEAEQTLLQSKEDYPADTDIRFNLTYLYEETDRLDQAKAELIELLKIDPQNSEAQEFMEALKLGSAD